MNALSFRNQVPVIATCVSRYVRGLSNILTSILLLSLCHNSLKAENSGTQNIAITLSNKVIQMAGYEKIGSRAKSGDFIEYSLNVTAYSALTPFAFCDNVPAGMSLFVGDVLGNGSGPVDIVENESGLNYSFADLASQNDTLEFSNNEGRTFDYFPAPDADGFDRNITHFRIAPRGFLMPADGTDTRFSLRYRMRIN